MQGRAEHHVALMEKMTPGHLVGDTLSTGSFFRVDFWYKQHRYSCPLTAAPLFPAFTAISVSSFWNTSSRVLICLFINLGIIFKPNFRAVSGCRGYTAQNSPSGNYILGPGHMGLVVKSTGGSRRGTGFSFQYHVEVHSLRSSMSSSDLYLHDIHTSTQAKHSQHKSKHTHMHAHTHTRHTHNFILGTGERTQLLRALVILSENPKFDFQHPCQVALSSL